MGRVLGFLDSLDQRWLMGSPPLEQEEVVLWSSPMGYIRDGVARGGILYVTTSRVLFQPNRLERRMGVATLAWPRHHIDRVELVHELNLIRGAGGAFVVKTKSGEFAEFAVYGAERAVNALRTLVFGSDVTGQE